MQHPISAPPGLNSSPVTGEQITAPDRAATTKVRRFTPAALVSVVPRANPALLKLRGHHPVGIALSVPDIDVSTVPARHWVPSTAIIAPAAVIPAAISLQFLRRQVAVWIAHPITRADVPAVVARRRANRHAVLNFLNRGLAVA